MARQEQGQVLNDLVKVSDVVFDNFCPGVMAKLQIDYPPVRQIQPRIIACSISGFGPYGPYRERPAFDIALQALSGAMSITGAGDMPVRMGIPMGDLAGGMYAAFAIAARHMKGGLYSGIPFERQWSALSRLSQQLEFSEQPGYNYL